MLLCKTRAVDDIARLAAIEAIKKQKARYFRGVDTADGDLVRSMLAEDCVLDLRGCCTDPTSGVDYLPQMNGVLRGRSAWPNGGMRAAGIVSVHEGHQCEIEPTSDTSADAIFAMSDRLFMPAGSAFAVMTGFGFYIETYLSTDAGWMLKTMRIERIRVEVS
jgi:hypothetical protein